MDSEVPISCPGSVTLNVIFEAQTFVDVLNATACNRVRNDGTHCIDLTSLALPTIPGQPDPVGTWTTPPNYTGDDSDVTNICFDGLPIGEDFAFTFLGANTSGICADPMGTATIRVEDCNCPSIVVADASNLCNTDSFLDLGALVGANTVAGSWSAENSNGDPVSLFGGSFFDPIGQPAGEYFLIYTPDVTPPVDCVQADTTSTMIFASPNAGTVTTIAAICTTDPQVVNLADLLDGEDAGGVWTETSIAPSIGAAFDALSLIHI